MQKCQQLREEEKLLELSMHYVFLLGPVAVWSTKVGYFKEKGFYIQFMLQTHKILIYPMEDFTEK